MWVITKFIIAWNAPPPDWSKRVSTIVGVADHPHDHIITMKDEKTKKKVLTVICLVTSGLEMIQGGAYYMGEEPTTWGRSLLHGGGAYYMRRSLLHGGGA